MEPFVVEIPYHPSLKALAAWSDHPGTILLHSGRYHETFGRFSFLVMSPFQVLTVKNGMVDLNGNSLSVDSFQALKACLAHNLTPRSDLPPFQGGVVGYFAYELAHNLEKLPRVNDDLNIPDIKVGCYDLVISFDHTRRQCWVISSGLPYEGALRDEHARKRAKSVVKKLENLPQLEEKSIAVDGVVSNFDAHEYVKAVGKVKEYILSGDIFQANMTRRFETYLSYEISAFDLFLASNRINPAPFSAYLHWPELSIISASPERFLSVIQGKVETKPIKGTRKRGETPEEDQQLAQDLLKSEKDRAENLMIVDLMRNDLSRVCQPFTVDVPKLLELESYATVHHLVSTVTGQLKQGCDVIDLLRATFPGGSITGAPKIRAMEIISELEQVARGVYCGSIGYIGFDGAMDTNIAIRTFTKVGQRLIFNAGGAIVTDSDPMEEFDETTTKAFALLKAIGQ